MYAGGLAGSPAPFMKVMEKIYMVVKDVTVKPGYRGYNIVGVFDALNKAKGCLLRMRDNVIRRFGRDYTEVIGSDEICLAQGDYRCSLRVQTEVIGKDMSYFDMQRL